MSDTQVLYGEEDAPEVVRTYDSDTGIEIEESVAGVVAHEENQAILESQALTALKGTHGWAIVKEFIDAYTTKWSEQLILEKEFDEIRRIQESLKAYHGLTAFIESKINEGAKFMEEEK